MAEVNTQLPENAVEFCEQFPEGRLCRFVNRRSGTLLDVRSLDLVNDAVPRVVGNAEKDGVQYWIITPLGDGQAIIPVPRDGSGRVLYLTPSTIDSGRPVTISPFPTSWQILPSSECPTESPLTGFSVPQGLYEEWTCLICYPHFRNGEPRMLDLWAGEVTPNNRVVVYPLSGTQWQFWRVQFIRYQNNFDDDSDHIDEGQGIEHTHPDGCAPPESTPTKPNGDAPHDTKPDVASAPDLDPMPRTITSVRSLWIENTLRANIQISITLAIGANHRPIYIGPWIVAQDRRSIDVWQLTRARRPHLPAGTRFHFGVRTSEGWTFNTSRLFSLGTSVSLIGPNSFMRGTPTVPYFRFQ